jgi:hypothetical protein
MSKATNLSSQFVITGGKTTITNLAASVITTGALQVGGSGMASQVRIFDTGSNLIGFVGDDSGSSGYVGAWFKRCGIGGSPLSPGMYADYNGNVVANTLYITNSGGSTGWIGSNAGYTGAWFKTVMIGGTSPGSAKIIADINGNLGISGNLITGTISSVTITATTITGTNISGGSISGTTISGTTITGGTVSGTNVTASTFSCATAQGTVTINNGTYGIRIDSGSDAVLLGIGGLLVSQSGWTSTLYNTSLWIANGEAINSNRCFTGAGGVNVGRYAQIIGRTFCPYDSGGSLWTGQDYTVWHPNGFQIGSNTYHWQVFVGGVFVSFY